MYLYSNNLIQNAQETGSRSIKELLHPRFEHLSAAALQKGSLSDLDDGIRLGRSERLAIKEILQQ